MFDPEGVLAPEILRYFFRDEPWREQALCKDLDLPRKERLALFFPDRGGSQALAKATCAKCPVSVECDEFRIKSKSEYGIWGGKISRRLGQAPGKTSATEDLVS